LSLGQRLWRNKLLNSHTNSLCLQLIQITKHNLPNSSVNLTFEPAILRVFWGAKHPLAKTLLSKFSALVSWA
jgi:hypothetical protein